MTLVGRANWWLPGWLERLLPKVSVEGASDTGELIEELAA
jgi:RND superfamily putative drug exporter